MRILLSNYRNNQKIQCFGLELHKIYERKILYITKAIEKYKKKEREAKWMDIYMQSSENECF